ncbi:hypothetical protein [Parabacteroides sp. HGS0025]|uniref:hypothetical protein n=1 Tax=Parabacteroides sp. HGS0025 TaxID=1078087 RepID=UPI0012F91F63|nr:hypothetical protein [Parabacteroides sp. HGS0025]
MIPAGWCVPEGGEQYDMVDPLRGSPGGGQCEPPASPGAIHSQPFQGKDNDAETF